MKSTIFSKKNLALLVLALAPVFVQAALTDLATKPISGGTEVGLPPNIMFILDESQSMGGTSMPDWANGYNNSNQKRGFTPDAFGQTKNSSFNGLAYNPATTYTPPVFFSSSGAIDTTTYLAQNRANTTNWTKVYIDPFINLDPSTKLPKTKDLSVDNLYYFTTIPGEFCKNRAMLSCQKEKTDVYSVPAPLRWCRTPTDATSDSPNIAACQALEIDNLDTEIKFANPRMPWPNLSVLTIPEGGGSVDTITVNDANILSAETGVQNSRAALAMALQDNINLCSFETAGDCGTSGYRAIYDNIEGKVYIYAPQQFDGSVTPNVSGSVATNPTAFASINTNYAGYPDESEMTNKVGGINLPTVIFPQLQKYPKDAGRTDCLTDTNYCTYDEEMTNYANWYAYYRTRMQMMKTATSQAFSSLTDGFRVGFMSINNETGTSNMGDLFLNIDTFTSEQKLAWYKKLFSAAPSGDTPLRMALAQAGRIYAGQLKGIYNKTEIRDPVLHSCQTNVTMLSTDGYWTATKYYETFDDKDYGVKLDGKTEVGHQDSLDGVVRPQLDAGQPTFTLTTTQRIKTIKPTVRPQARVTTTTAKHYQLQTRKQDVFQYKESFLQAKTWQLTKTVWPLQVKTAQLLTQTGKLQQREWGPLVFNNRYDVKVDRVKMLTTSYSVTKTENTLKQVKTPLKKTLYTVKQTDSQLYVTPMNLKQTNYKLQIAHSQQAQMSSDDGATWTNVVSCAEFRTPIDGISCRYGAPSGFTDVPTNGDCTPVSIPASEMGKTVIYDLGNDNQRTSYKTQTSCRYVEAGTSSPDTCKPSTLTTPTATEEGTKYPSSTQTKCEYVLGEQEVAKDTCTNGTASTKIGENWLKYATCAYIEGETKPVPINGSCTITQRSAGPTYDVLKATACAYDVGTTATGDDNLDSCSSTANQTSSSTGAVYKSYIGCSYNTAKEVTSYPSSCVAVGTGSGPSYTSKVVCSYDIKTPKVKPSECVPLRDPEPCSEADYSCKQVVTCSTKTPTTANPAVSYPTSCTKITTEDQVVDCISENLRTDKNQASCPPDTAQYTYTCTKLPGTATCDPGVSGDCVWGWGAWHYVSTCTRTVDDPTKMSPDDRSNATDCAYDASFSCTDNSGANCWSNATAACVPNTDKTITKGKPMLPLVSCKYSGYTSASNADTSSCTSDKTVSIAVNTLSTGYQILKPKQCGYWSTNSPITDVSSCQQVSATKVNSVAPSGTTYSNNVEVCSYTVVKDWDNVDSCTPQQRPNIASSSTVKYTQLNATECKYDSDNEWKDTPSGQACVPSESACTGLPTENTFCSQTSCSSSLATCSVGKVTECEPKGYSDWTDVTDASKGCTTQTANQSTIGVECQYKELDGLRYYVGDANFTDCARINTRPTVFSINAPPIAADSCTKSYILPDGVNGWLDIPVDTERGQKITAGTVGIYNNNSLTFLAEHLPDAPNNSPSPEIHLVAGYNIEYNKGDASALPSQVFADECPDSDQTTGPDGDNTYLHNQITCTNKPLPDETGRKECPVGMTDMGNNVWQTPPLASNDWKTLTCKEVPGAATQNTLADVAQYYYMTDLRSPALDNCTGSLGNDVCENNKEATEDDPATWQHMQTYTLGLGASGYMQYNDKYTSGGSEDFNAIAGGTKSDLAEGICAWQTDDTTCNWPKPAPNRQTNIDDLWHAAVNGRGIYYSATSPTSLALGLGEALKYIGQKGGSSSGVTLSSPILTLGDNYVFYSTYAEGTWTGEVFSRTVNLETGEVDSDHCLYDDDSNPATPAARVVCLYDAGGMLLPGLTEKIMPPVWAAQKKLDDMLSVSPDAYLNKRNVFTGKKGSVDRRPFLWDNLTTTERGYFSETAISTLSQIQCDAEGDIGCLSEANRKDAAGANLVNFIRGDFSKEDGAAVGLYRKRLHFLGDIVNASPAYAKAPSALYIDKGYWKHKQNMANRTPMVYVGANDGMLHAFYAVKDTAKGIDGGTEAWAYIPRMVMPNLFRLADKNYNVKHQFFVDGTPVVGDICTDNCSSAKEDPPATWKTILVGGLNHGGAGFYALDITDPIYDDSIDPLTNEIKGPKVLWEFSVEDDPDIGFTFGNPLITKLSGGKWVVMFTSGYNNTLTSGEDNSLKGDGKGHLYILDAATGELINKISTGVGSASDPSGLSRINAWANYPMYDNTAERVYGGDLLGNLWRFDINACHKDNPESECRYYAQLLAILKNGKRDLQPMTAKPELGKVDGKPFVYVGTGQLLGPTDMFTASGQSVYGIHDPLSATTAASALTAIYDNPRDDTKNTWDGTKNKFLKQEFRNSLCTTQQISDGTCDVVAEEMMLSTNELSFAQGYHGWYVDFTVGAERADTDLLLTGGTLIVNTNVPVNAGVCSSSAYNNRYYINAANGGGIGETIDGYAYAGGYRMRGLVGNTTIGSTGKDKFDYNLIDGFIDKGTPEFAQKAPPPRHVSWRQLLTDD